MTEPSKEALEAAISWWESKYLGERPPHEIAKLLDAFAAARVAKARAQERERCAAECDELAFCRGMVTSASSDGKEWREGMKRGFEMAAEHIRALAEPQEQT